jgi:hypothetical protein
MLLALPATLWCGSAVGASSPLGTAIEVSFSESVHRQPITGRLFVMISRQNEPEVRLQSTWLNSPEILGLDVKHLNPGRSVTADASVPGTPLKSLGDIPPGNYYIQAVLNVYTEFHRADGHVIWAHMDQGEGQQFNTSPGNLYSKMQLVHLDPSSHIRLDLSEVIPPLPPTADTAWVKYIRIQSKLLTQFWGRPIYLGAIVLLPRDYDSHPNVRYPVIYEQVEHSRASPAFGFRTDSAPEPESVRRQRETAGYESGYEVYQAWRSDQFPRMVVASFITTTPFADWSGGVDSANNGPYGKAIVTELIPFLESRFRIISEPYARVLTGRASGGRAALALQLFHPEFFGGTWVFRPWPFNFRHYFSLNIYENENAFFLKSTDLPEFGRNPSEWLQVERGYARNTAGTPFVLFTQTSRHDAVMAGMAGGDPIGADDAILGPVGDNGMPKPLWDRATGRIDRSVADYWRQNGDLLNYTQQNWSKIGPQLLGKLHLFADEADEFYRNYGVHGFEDFLKTTVNPHYAGSFSYSFGTSHSGGWVPMTHQELLRTVANQIERNAPDSANTVAWHY